MFWTLSIGLAIIAIYAAYILWNRDAVVYKDLLGRHVVITGGSSGIGKAAACEAARMGAHVTIIGRDITKLQNAAKEVLAKCADQDNQIIQYAVLDVTSEYDIIHECFSQLEEKVGPIFMLVNCAGACICGLFELMKVEDVKAMINLNYYGTAFPTHWVLPKMRKRNEGTIVFVASEAALIGIYGYSAYSGAKWAVRGLFEAVGMELVGTKARVMLSYPPDTDTPGLQMENTTKPEETKIISGSGGLHSPEVIGAKMIQDAMKGKTYSTYSLSGKIMNTMYGVSIESVSQIITQIFFSGMLRAILVGILATFHRVIKDQIKIRNNAQNGAR